MVQSSVGKCDYAERHGNTDINGQGVYMGIESKERGSQFVL
jgi:hypothetical protein